ncbi:hypothetical protein EMPG_16797 [Blastomyces silverae]|uniref:Vacuolar protein sorting-associated protein 17 n=1 Tax=Blastomyces silverae TaxID=2060906 RepID=A0A0H1B9F0_9EURO|nr:hypothetical protein EMPG_16797 [Blastomyces silverae]
MDYSSLPHDPEHPVGSSPWGSTSPRADRTFPASDVPPSPLPPQQSPYGPDGERQQDEESTTQGLSERLQGSQIDDQVHEEHSPYPPSNHEQPPQQRAQVSARYQTGARNKARPNAPQYKLQAKITGLERTGKKDPILRFDVHTNIPKFRTTQFRDVRRTHSEFIKLADHLISSNPEAIVPAVPPPLTPAGAGTDEDEIRVKASMQRWLNYVCANDALMQDDEMILFVESDFGYSPVVRMKQPATGVRRKVLKQFAPPPDDTPELQDARPVVKLFYLGTMDAGQKVDRVVKARKSLALAESDLGVKMGQMHVQETHPGLANAYRKLGKVIQAVGDYHAAQGTAEATTFGDPLNYHSSDAFIVKETLTNRHILLRELIQAQQSARSKRAAADRLKGSTSVRSDKRTTADMLLSIREYTLREIEAERRTLSTLESIRPDIRAIDASGGLSRLGRESHPAARRASLAASQGPKGDAWSGVPRRGDSLNRSISGSFIAPIREDEGEANGGRTRNRSLSGSGMIGLPEEEDDDRVDAKNAASRLATSTF